AQLPQAFVVLHELGQPARGAERSERAAGDLPAGLREPGVVEGHEPRIVIVGERAPGPRRRGERDELRIGDGGASRLAQRALGAGGRQIAGLAPEADPPAIRRVENRLDAEAVRFGRLGLLDAVAGDVRGVVEPRQHGGVRRREHLGLADVRLTRDERQRYLARSGQLLDGSHLLSDRLLSALAAPSGYGPRRGSPCLSIPGAVPRARGGCASRAGRECRWPPGTARAGTFNKRLPGLSWRFLKSAR